MDQSAAVVASYSTLAGICGYSVATVRRAVDDLKADRWIQVVQIGGKGGANAFVINSRVAWAAPRDQLPMAAFSARVLASAAEQDAETLAGPDLRRVPHLMHPGERQLPTGVDMDPPIQPSLDGLDPDLPSVEAPNPFAGMYENQEAIKSFASLDTLAGELEGVVGTLGALSMRL
jgi:hypothetical protein